MAEEKLLPADALEKNAPKAIPPLAGFWFRLGALALDLFLIRLVLQVTYPALQPFYLSLGSGSVVVPLAVSFLYLALGEGPVGKGKTLGKAILQIRATDLRGEMLSPPAAALRALLMLLLAAPFLGGEVAVRLAVRGQRVGEFLAGAGLNGLGTSYILANVFLVVLDPLKRTVPDHVAGSIVVREAGAHNLPLFLEQIQGQAAPLQRRAIQVAWLAFVALGAIYGFTQYRRVFSAESEQYAQFAQSFDKDFAYNHLRPTLGAVPLGAVENVLAREGLTTASWAAHLPKPTKPGEALTSQTQVVVIQFRSNSAIRSDDLGTTKDLDVLMTRAVSWTDDHIQNDIYLLDRKSRMTMAGAFPAKPPIFQPRLVAVVFVEEVSLLYLRNSRFVWADVRPLALPASFYQEDLRAARKIQEETQTRQKKVSSGASDRPTSGSP